jgi:hypothetical protein
MAKQTDPEPTPTKVEITVAGHTVTVESVASIEQVSAAALDLYRKTKLAAKKIPFGFDLGAAQVERVEQPDYSGHLERWQEEDHAGLGWIHPEGKPSV